MNQKEFEYLKDAKVVDVTIALNSGNTIIIFKKRGHRLLDGLAIPKEVVKKLRLLYLAKRKTKSEGISHPKAMGIRNAREI